MFKENTVKAIQVKNVSVRYMMGDFRDIGLKDFILQKLQKKYNAKEFLAVNNVSFELEKGDLLGIIGTNGSGKSTFLKALTNILTPSEGTVHVEGNISALLELASGFDPDLTVKENTFLRAAILGYKKSFIHEKYQEIIAFAELEEFENRAFKQLSSGMKSRLAFSIASLVQPDILILDEVLSVGDASFRQKSEAKMNEILQSGATAILVSHSLAQIKRMCNKVLWLNKGEQMAFGDCISICDEYEKHFNLNKK